MNASKMYLPEPARPLPAPAGHTREIEAFGQTRDGNQWAVHTREETSYLDPGAAMPPTRNGSTAIVFIAGAGTAQIISTVTVGLLYGTGAFIAVSAVFIATCAAITLAGRR